jgi:hypothetical protein
MGVPAIRIDALVKLAKEWRAIADDPEFQEDPYDPGSTWAAGRLAGYLECAEALEELCKD